MKKKVLIIDDEVAFTNVVKLTLEAKGDYDVCVENNPRQAIATARTFIPNIIILDVVMPEFDGGEVHTQFKADPILKRVPIIFLTAIVRQREVDEHHGMIGGSVYLAKPVSADDLVKAIEANGHF
jgi:CheY-like chemotaxis protein